MEGWLRSISLGLGMLMLLACDPGARAAEREQVIQPQVERRAIERAGIDAQDFETGVFFGLMNVEDFGTNPVYGARFGYHVTEDVFAEATYGMTETGKTSFERLSGNIQLLSDNDRRLRYMDIDVGFNILPGESFVGGSWAFTSAFYVIGGIGATRFGGSDTFTWNVGAGYRALLSDSLSLRLDVRDHVFDQDLLGQTRTSHNLGVNGGVAWFF